MWRVSDLIVELKPYMISGSVPILIPLSKDKHPLRKGGTKSLTRVLESAGVLQKVVSRIPREASRTLG